jgi:lactoylglutathione lyase
MKTALQKLILTAFAVVSLSLLVPSAGYSQSNIQPTFDHYAICAKNLKISTQFYKTVLQLKEIKHPFKDTVHTWLSIGPSLQLHIIQVGCPPINHDISTHLCFRVASLEDYIKYIETLHVKYVTWTGEPNKITVRADGVKQIYIQDPDGYWIEVNDAKG